MWYLIIFFISISIIMSPVDMFFLCPLGIWMSILENFPFDTQSVFLFHFYLLNCMSSWHFEKLNPRWSQHFQILLPFIWLSFSFANCFFSCLNGYSNEDCSVMSDFLWPHGLYSPWNSLGQKTGVGSCSFLQGIFPTQGSNQVSCTAGRFFTNGATRKALKWL